MVIYCQGVMQVGVYMCVYLSTCVYLWKWKCSFHCMCVFAYARLIVCSFFYLRKTYMTPLDFELFFWFDHLYLFMIGFLYVHIVCRCVFMYVFFSCVRFLYFFFCEACSRGNFFRYHLLILHQKHFPNPTICQQINKNTVKAVTVTRITWRT